jgi:hypothetical protein
MCKEAAVAKFKVDWLLLGDTDDSELRPLESIQYLTGIRIGYHQKIAKTITAVPVSYFKCTSAIFLK